MRELGFEDGVDTLGRWMAHHLAELIDLADHGATPDERVTAQQRATETILMLWEHRAALPGNAYPLAPYKNVLVVLDRLRPENNPIRPFWAHHTGARMDQLTADLFDNLAHLIIALLLMKIPRSMWSAEVAPTTIEALSETEQRVLHALQEWATVFTSTTTVTKGASHGKKDRHSAEVDPGESAVQLIDRMSTILTTLRSELGRAPTAHGSNASDAIGGDAIAEVPDDANA